jgi:hydroxymethylglutaryl-CoA reductase (NADPH)
LTSDFIRASLNGFFKEKKVLSIKLKNDVLLENGIITNVAARISKKLIGFFPIQISFVNKTGESMTLDLLLKSKALDEEVIKGLHLIAASIDPQLSDLFKKSKQYLEFRNSHLKELELYSYLHEKGFKNIPFLYGMHKDPKREIYFFIQSLLDRDSLKIMDSGNQPEKWMSEDILRVIKVITHFHKTVDLTQLSSIQEFLPWHAAELYKKLLSILINESADHKHVNQLVELNNQIDHFQEEAAAIHLHRTIIHNDFNPRNIAVERNGEPIIYDWELAVIDLPHRDVVEFLSFTLPVDFKKEDLLFFLKYHFGLYPGDVWEEWLKAYRYSLKVYIVTRVSFYEVSGILIKYDFSKRILSTAFKMLAFLNDDE